MNLKNYAYYYPDGFNKKLCHDIINYSKQFDFKTGVTGDKDARKRQSDIIWFKNETWIAKEIMNFIDDANKKAEWNFELLKLEAIQFTKYAHNQFYTWHTDDWKEPYKKGEENEGLQRKLSFVCNLVEPDDYLGGNLEIHVPLHPPDSFSYKDNVLDISKQNYKMGSIVVFPSFLFHRVKPIRVGIRYSLVGWCLGKPLR